MFSPIDRARIVCETRDGRRVEGRETLSEVQSRPRPHTRGSQHDHTSRADVTAAGTLTPVRALQLTRPPCISDTADADIVVSGPDGDRAPYLSRV